MCGGHLVTMEQLAAMLRRTTGRRYPVPPVPPGALRAAGRALDALRRYLPFDSPMTAEAMDMVTRWPGTDDAEMAALGIEARDAADTLDVSLRAWYETGLLSARQVGAVAGDRDTHAGAAGFKIPARVLASKPFRAVAPRVLPPMHRLVHRVSGGRTLLDSDSQPMGLLVTTGARSGEPRETPLAVVPDGPDRFLVVGSNFARESHPQWTANLFVHPRATLTFRGVTSPVEARLLAGDERARRWQDLLVVFPNWDDYTRVTAREFRVFELTRVFG